MGELFPNIHLRRSFALPINQLYRVPPHIALFCDILEILRTALFFIGIFALLLAAHLCHSGVLWEGEDLPLAAALQMKHGAVLYRDVWFDKPPLVPVFYLLWGAATGQALRIAGALYSLLACVLAYLIATTAWTRREGYAAAAFLAFFLTFDTHSSVLPIAADLLLLVPQLAAILFALRKQPLWSGAAAGVGFLINTKSVFVLAACAVFAWPALPLLAVGFAAPLALAAAWLGAAGAMPAYIDQVWRWSSAYAASPVVSDPVRNGLLRTVNWLGFHAALVIGAALLWTRREGRKYLLWIAICYPGVVLGWRFFPRYFFLILPALTIGAARGVTVARSRVVNALVLLALAVPLVRFGPRYVTLAADLLHHRESNWSDVALDQDSRAAARLALASASPDSTLYVWGYRPDIFVYTGLAPANRYLDSQALTGVPADRHLTQSQAVTTAGTHEARLELAASKPGILIDGLSLYNPALSMDHYEELRPWLTHYREAGRTKGTIIYVRTDH